MKNRTQNGMAKLLSEAFLKIQIGHISGSIVEKLIQFVFFVCKFEGYQCISKLKNKLFIFNHVKVS